ncbi:protein charybde isoform X1 [Drosophila bipectinata]|uniref:protein charybde isoform X1 n=1 Tax=Drosophila bipectinata TaxID=42026 RepID=UPI001C8914E6|nr:protein charybde isoform X1 [Drosophila bipectinata]
MKMEVLSVQNHIQGKFGVKKIKVEISTVDWPTAASDLLEEEEEEELTVAGTTATGEVLDVDVVDGHPASVLHMRQHQALNTRPLPTPTVVGGGGGSGIPSPKQATSAVAAASFEAPISGGSAAAYHHAYMTNVLASTNQQQQQQYHPLPASPLQSTAGARFGASDNLDDVSASAVRELSQQLQAHLRDAKRRHLACTEVTLPNDLTQRIAAEIIRMSEREPCGERACTLFIEFESEPNNVRRIASFKVDPDTVSIFELYLTLRQDKSGWTSLLPQFIKNLTRSNTINISPDFTLTKNKLYSSE